MIQLTYKGVDITDSVSINQCYHDMYAGGRSDTLNIRVNDTKHIWDSWGASGGDEIRVDYGPINTGTMFVSSVRPRNGVVEIIAQAAPLSGFDATNKAWQRVRLLQIAEEIARKNNLSFQSYGVEDRRYDYVLQSNEGDFKFLNRRAMLEGCAILIYNKTLILYSEEYMESQSPAEAITVPVDGDYNNTSNGYALYGSCIVENGLYSGEYSVDNGSSRIYRPSGIGNIGSNEEARRFAKNILRDKNKGCFRGYLRTNVLPGYAAASMITVVNDRAPSWNGSVFIDHLRNDYGRGQSKIFFRKPLEGY